jgi:hydroxyethylthiazole kinase-like uncharacterized protein yjeF
MNKVLSTPQIRQLEAQHFKERKLPEASVIEQVGRSIFEMIKLDVASKRVLVLSGQGNNGADALVVARLLHFHGIDVTLCLISGQGSAEYLRQREICQSFKLKQVDVNNLIAGEFDLCLDGVFGIGCKLPLPVPVKNLLKKINSAQIPVWAIDTPSGINAESGEVDQDCPTCQKTFCIGGVKWFQLTDSAFEKSGDLIVVDACFDETLYPLSGELITSTNSANRCGTSSQQNPEKTYKNKKGHVLVVGGSAGMTGAPILSAYAALKSGAGLVTLATLEELREEVSKRSPIELMVKDVAKLTELSPYQAIVFGPGVMADTRWSVFLQKLQDSRKDFQGAVLFDAGFFDLYNAETFEKTFSDLGERCVLTPHVGEFDRFFNSHQKKLTMEKIHLAQKYAEKNKLTVLYKSFRTLSFNGDGSIHYLCSPTANLATAGSGDVLSGMIASHLLSGPVKERVAVALLAHNQAGHRITDQFGSHHQATALDILSVL